MPFREVLGQQRVIRVLQKALATDNLPHAFLFYGTEGVGRFKTALALAGALFCGSAQGDACGECPDCRRVQQETHPGLSVIRPLSKKGEKDWIVDPDRGEIRIDQVRELQKWFSMRSFEGGWRVCILDGAEKMNPAAANALLKTLEEPPPDSLLVLVGPTKTQLPLTVVSRCQSLYFPPVPCAEIEEFLRRNPGELAPEDLSLAAALSGGSVGRALHSDPEWVSGERRRWLRRLTDCIGSGSSVSTVSLAEELAGSDRLAQVLELFLLWFRDLALFRGIGDADRLLNRDLVDEIQEISERRDTLNWVGKVRIVQQARADLAGRQNLNTRLVMETMLLELSDCGQVV
jgi:DNA polymerase-3 subunit delta'